MPRRQALPRLWLMTDERMGAGLWDALVRLPRGSGVVFRHYATPTTERRRLFGEVIAIARERGLVVLRAGPWCGVGADGVHNRRGRGLRTASAHSLAEARMASRAGVDAVFVSPVFATRSHRGEAALGVDAAERIARGSPVPAIALGGMDAARFAGMRGFYGWAGIDAWLTDPDAAPIRAVGPR